MPYTTALPSSFRKTYRELVHHLARMHRLYAVQGILGWDEQVFLPSGAGEFRAQQNADLATLLHREATAPQVGEWLDKLEGDLDPHPREVDCVIREARRDYDRAVRLPAEFVARKSQLNSDGYQAWARAREADRYADFAPWLQRQVDLLREEASYLGCGGDAAYDYHIDLHDPGMTAARIEALFARLREDLVPLARAVNEKAAANPAPPLDRFDTAGQHALVLEVCGKLGFDFAHGRMDVSIHPFCGGAPEDVRMTTRYREHDLTDALYGAIHETGHALYEQSLGANPPGTGLGRAAGMGVHESQSRLWENQIARSAAFWEFLMPLLRRHFPERTRDLPPEACLRSAKAVSRQPIRVDADEINYNLHIMLRFDIEQRLFSGSLEVKDVPEAWRALSRDMLGLVPATDKDGCLQDIHWSWGSFGYFPSYTLGNMLAAQLWNRMRSEIRDIDALIARGEFAPLLLWLRDRVHRHGRLIDLNSAAQSATGEPLNPAYLAAYLRERYA